MPPLASAVSSLASARTKSRNPLAFAHEGPNLVAPAMMGKRARFSIREGERSYDPAAAINDADGLIFSFSHRDSVFWSALFSGLETALFSLKSHQLRRLEEKHPSLKQFIQVFRRESATRPERPSARRCLGEHAARRALPFLIWRGPLADRTSRNGSPPPSFSPSSFCSAT